MENRGRKSTGGRKKRRTQMCRKCGKRQARVRSDTACIPCLQLVTAENTFERYGIPRENAIMQRMRERAETYNKLMRAGKTRAEAAEAMGYTLSGLSSLMWKARLRGIDVVVLNNHTSQIKPKAVAKTNNANDHGGGKYGVTGCSCEPCVTRRRETRREQYAASKNREG